MATNVAIMLIINMTCNDYFRVRKLCNTAEN